MLKRRNDEGTIFLLIFFFPLQVTFAVVWGFFCAGNTLTVVNGRLVRDLNILSLSGFIGGLLVIPLE